MCVVKYVCIPGPFGSVQFHCLCPCNEPKNLIKWIIGLYNSRSRSSKRSSVHWDIQRCKETSNIARALLLNINNED